MFVIEDDVCWLEEVGWLDLYHGMMCHNTSQEGTRVVVYLKDADMPLPDKYNTSQVAMLLCQLCTYKGFYDKHNEFIGVWLCGDVVMW